MTSEDDVLEALEWGADPEAFNAEDRLVYEWMLFKRDRMLRSASRREGPRTERS